MEVFKREGFFRMVIFQNGDISEHCYSRTEVFKNADYSGIGEWAPLDLQSIQHHDYFGHLSIC